MFKKIVGLGFSAKGKNAKDVEKYISGLVQGGATEFFTGYNPPYWHTKFGFEVSPNGRFAEHEQITDFETLKQIVLEVHKHGLELFINLNARYYTDEVFELIKQMVEEFKEIGIDGIICGNIGILEYLKEINYKGKINISTIMSLYNTESIRFFLENYKINKIILSREITLKEIEKLVSSFPEVKFEVFGEGDFCRYNNGLCFAEHKYGERDICTVVVNDLVVKKKFKPNFKKIILDKNISNEEKVDLLDDSYENIFQKIENILTKIEIFSEEKENLEKQLLQIFKISQNRVDLYFDALKPINSEHNKNIFSYLKGLKYLTGSLKNNDFLTLQKELEDSVKSGMKYLMEKTKRVGGDAKLKAEELAKFYARSDNLNLYTYLFFSKFKNIETVKFPTRGRNYNEKLAILEEVVNSAKVDEKYLDRGISLERAHYDLTYLFGEKLWFRKMLKNFLD
ncbi:hypothetical protein BLD25_00400 [Candidatus Gracilibacteria bacterium GN02-872]|nr:hypothetical protein BLD25_00400 [Candidatus Gracilibacteria bacterium GN02-872]